MNVSSQGIIMEQWLPIIGFDTYEVSNQGYVRNKYSGRILKPSYTNMGYEQVCLIRNGNRYGRQVHRLVALAFCEGYKIGLEVNHDDGIKTNNNSSNLIWVTHGDNIRHAYATGLAYNNNKDKRKAVEIIETGEVFESLTECARYLHVNRSVVCNVLKGRLTSVRGFTVRYVEC